MRLVSCYALVLGVALVSAHVSAVCTPASHCFVCVCVCAARWLQPVLAQLISTLRAPKSSEGYKKIGGGSPLRRITQEQANALEEALRVRGQDAHVYVGMRYWYPFMEDAVAQVRPAAQPCCRMGYAKIWRSCVHVSHTGGSGRTIWEVFDGASAAAPSRCRACRAARCNVRVM